MHHTSKVSWLKARLNFYCHFFKTNLKQFLNKAEFYIYSVFICNHNQKVTCTDDFSIMKPCPLLLTVKYKTAYID